MKKLITTLFTVISISTFAQKDYHVSVKGADNGDGSAARPLKTIQAAANKAMPGDNIIVHAGIYRERIDPPRGGTSDNKRITYKAAPGEKVMITGSEKATGWKKVGGNIWKLTLPSTYFGNFNPYTDVINGDWYDDRGWKQHTGAVYLNGVWLAETPSLDKLSTGKFWYTEVDGTNTNIWASFGSANPNKSDVEINVRKTVFYPSKTGINYITVSGFTMKNAATPWAPPTAEQVGLIGTNWSKGWIIENNDISYSICSGIALGKYGDEFDNTSANTATGYVETVKRALDNGWNSASVGHHVVKNNIVSFCEQAGIVGSLGCSFSTITGNTIHDVHMRRSFSGAEMGAIKFHGAVDLTISGNHIYHNSRGIWLDWMGQGARITGNLLYDHDDWDIYFEVDHGPIMVDNNIMLSRNSQRVWAQGVAYVYNLIGGKFEAVADNRVTPVLEPHGTKLLGLHDNPIGDIRLFNNIFFSLDCHTGVFDKATLPVTSSGNVYCYGAKPGTWEKDAYIYQPDTLGQASLSTSGGKVILNFEFPKLNGYTAAAIKLGTTAITKEGFETPDGKLMEFDRDFLGSKRSQNPYAGPLELKSTGTSTVELFTMKSIEAFSWKSWKAIPPAPNNWHLMDKAKDGYYGISLEKAKQTMTARGKVQKPVIVAIIDSGIDTTHEAFKGRLWMNEKELPGNKKDDDGNGYADDLNGYNFLGGKDGRNIGTDSKEGDRVFFKYKDRFAKDTVNLSPADAVLFQTWKRAALEREKERAALTDPAPYEVALKKLQAADVLVGAALPASYTLGQLDSLQTNDQKLVDGRNFLSGLLKANHYPSEGTVQEFISGFETYTADLKKQQDAFTKQVQDFRGDITKDNEDDLSDRNYGNCDVQALTPLHGTHVAGIVASIAPTAKLMVLRVVPDGDEHDKDIALAIRYAADNGARIINMSFGKDFSPHKDWIDDAVRYAEKKGVLFVQAAGNENKDIDTMPNFPTAVFLDHKRSPNWITVGASVPGDAPGTLKASFSNYGQKNVDVFAPGVNIWSSVPGGKYMALNGTSMASPVVTGMAAFLLSYYPELTPVQLKKLIEGTAVKPEGINLKEYSSTGGIANLYEAVKSLK